MTYKEFLEDIQGNALKPLYLFYGQERLMIDRMLETCRQRCLNPATVDFNYIVVEGDQHNFGQLYSLCEMLPAMDVRRILVVKQPNFLQKDLWTEAQQKQFLKFHQDEQCSTTTILWCETVDKRKKFVKEIGKVGRIISFDALDEIACVKWVQQEAKRLGLSLVNQQAQYFVQRSGYLHQDSTVDLYQMMSWLARLQGLVGDGTLVPAQIDQVLDQAVESNLFKWIDAVFEGQGNVAIRQRDTLIAHGEAPLKLFFMLHRHLRQLYKVKLLLMEGYSQGAICDQLGLKAFVVKKSANQVGKMKVEHLSEMLESVQQVDGWMKSSGVKPDLLLDYSMGKILEITKGAR